MRRGYVLAFLRVDGISYDFVNGKNKLLQKTTIPANIIENATELNKKECITLTSHQRVTADFVRNNKKKTSTANYEGEHIIHVYSNKIVIN